VFISSDVDLEAPFLNSKLEGHHFSAVRDCLFSILTATLPICRLCIYSTCFWRAF